MEKMCLKCIASLSRKTQVFIWFEKTFTLKYFNVCNFDLFDIMHDIFVGVAQYEIKKLFEYVTHHLTSEQDLLSRI